MKKEAEMWCKSHNVTLLSVKPNGFVYATVVGWAYMPFRNIGKGGAM